MRGVSEAARTRQLLTGAGVTRDCRAREFVPGRHAGGDRRQNLAGGIVDGLPISAALGRPARHSHCHYRQPRSGFIGRGVGGDPYARGRRSMGSRSRVHRVRRLDTGPG